MKFQIWGKSPPRARPFFNYMERYCFENNHELVVGGRPQDDAVRMTWHGHREAPNHWNVKIGHLESYYTVTKKGYSGWSEVCDEPVNYDAVNGEHADRFHHELFDKYVSKGNTKYAQPKQKLNERGYVLMLGQVAGDTVMTHCYFPNFKQAFTKTIELLHDSCDILIKKHPLAGEQPFLDRLADRYPSVKVVDADVHSLIERSKGVIVVNSGAGFESLLHLKHVFTLGKCDYQQAAHIIDSEEKIATIPDTLLTPVQDTKLKKFLLHYSTRRCVCTENYEKFQTSLEQVIK